jgi:tRNA dimethylallyltransferase
MTPRSAHPDETHRASGGTQWRPRLIAIVGPTASGKTSLAIEITRKLSDHKLEAVNADSRQVYRHMDIGTAKPTPEEQSVLPHQLIDIVYPDDPFSLATWLYLANEALASSWGRGHIPIVVGGTGQYVWSLLEGWRVPKVPPQEDLRRELGKRPREDLLEELRRVDPEARQYIQPQNVRRVIRALEVYYETGQPMSHWRTKDPPPFDWIAVGQTFDRRELYQRIDRRVDAMMETGFLDEVRSLREAGYSCELPCMSSIGYGEMCQHLDGKLPLDEAVNLTKTGTHRLARHQNAWFKGTDERICWVEGSEEAVHLASEFVSEG